MPGGGGCGNGLSTGKSRTSSVIEGFTQRVRQDSRGTGGGKADGKCREKIGNDMPSPCPPARHRSAQTDGIGLSVASSVRCRRLRAAIGAQRKAHRAAHTERI